MDAPLRVLAMVAAPSDAPSFDAVGCRRALEDALRPACTQGVATLEFLAEPTENALRKRLAYVGQRPTAGQEMAVDDRVEHRLEPVGEPFGQVGRRVEAAGRARVRGVLEDRDDVRPRPALDPAP